MTAAGYDEDAAIDRHASTAVTLEGRLQAAVGRMALPNGSPMINALRDLATVDIVESHDPRGADRWIDLSPRRVRELGALLVRLLNERPCEEATLPAGTPVSAHYIVGQVAIGGQHHLGVDCDRPGLLPAEELNGDLRGRNLDLLIHHIARLSSRRACGGLGLPHPVTINDDGVAHLLQWAPFPHAADAMLEHCPATFLAGCFRSATPESIRRLARSIVGDMGAFWNRSREVAARVAEAKASGRIIAAENDDVDLTAVSTDMSSQHFAPRFEVTLNFIAWDACCRRGTVRSTIDEQETAENHLGPHFAVTSETVAELRALGADGRIEGFAKAIVEAAPEGAKAVLSRLRTAHETWVGLCVGGRPIRAHLHWSAGTIRADFQSAEAALCYVGKHLRVRNLVLPATLATSAVGRRLDEVVHLSFPCDLTISGVSVKNTAPYQSTTFAFADDVWLIDASTGRIWRELRR